MCQCGYSPFGGGVALGLWLAHAVARGRDVDDTGSLSKVGCHQLGEVEGGGHAYAHGVLEVVPRTFVQPFHDGQGVVHQDVDVSFAAYDVPGEGFEHLASADVAHVVRPFLLVDDVHPCAVLLKFLCDAVSDALCASGHYNDFVFECFVLHGGSFYKDKDFSELSVHGAEYFVVNVC